MHLHTKKLIIFFLTFILGISVTACHNDTTETPNESQLPQLSNPDAVFISTGDFEITYEDLYNEVKTNDGLNQLLNMVDTDLLSDYILTVTQAEIDERIEKLIYSTNDQEEINNLDEDEKELMEDEFYNSMYLLGFGGREEEYVRLVVARENYAIDQITDEANEEEAWYAGPENLAAYYESTYNPNINTIKIRFLSEADAKSVLKYFNLVSIGGELRLYTGETPLANMPSSALNSSNTQSLTEEEVLEQFLILYNYVYGDYRDEVPTDSTLEDLLAIEQFTVEYDTLSEINSSLDDYVYESLGSYEEYLSGDDDKLFYTYEPVDFSSGDSSYYMILNLQKHEKADVEDFEGDTEDLIALIGQDIYDELLDELIQVQLDASSFVSKRLVTLRQEHDFNIYDYYIGIDYQAVDSAFEIDEEGHETIVCTYDDEIITADDLLTYSLNNNVVLYTIYAAQSPAVYAAHYADIYCPDESEVCEYDVMENDSEVMVEHWDSYESLENSFNNSYYASSFTFEEYLYLAYGVRSEYEMIHDYYVTSNLQTYIIYDEIIKNNYDLLNYLMELAQPFYDNYFSLDVEHLLIYVDRDEDGSPDDYNDFYSEMEDTTVYDQMLADFETAIRTYLDDEENSMSGLIVDFNKAKREDETWGAYKRYGFNLITEDIGQMTYSDYVGVYEDAFVDECIVLYQRYLLEENEHEDYLYSETLIETSYGVHLVKAAKGNAFEIPSALFTMTYDKNNEPEYLEELVNLTDILTFEQLQVYADYRFADIAYGTGNLEAIYGLVQPDMPDDVLDAIDEFYSALYDALYVVGMLNSIIIDQLEDGTYNNEISSYCSVTEAQFMERMSNISDIYWYQIFEGYDYTE